MNKQIAELCTRLDFHPQITEQFDLYESLLQAVDAGDGDFHSALPEPRLYAFGSPGVYLLDEGRDHLDLGMAWEQENSNPAVPLFLELFRSYTQEHPEMF